MHVHFYVLVLCLFVRFFCLFVCLFASSPSLAVFPLMSQHRSCVGIICVLDHSAHLRHTDCLLRPSSHGRSMVCATLFNNRYNCCFLCHSSATWYSFFSHMNFSSFLLHCIASHCHTTTALELFVNAYTAIARIFGCCCCFTTNQLLSYLHMYTL